MAKLPDSTPRPKSVFRRIFVIQKPLSRIILSCFQSILHLDFGHFSIADLFLLESKYVWLSRLTDIALYCQVI